MSPTEFDFIQKITFLLETLSRGDGISLGVVNEINEVKLIILEKVKASITTNNKGE